MFLIPNGIFQGSPDITVTLYIWKGVIPALLGNIVGGGFFVGTLYWYLHLQGKDEVAIDGVYYEPQATGSSYEGLSLKSLLSRHQSKAPMKGDERV